MSRDPLKVLVGQWRYPSSGAFCVLYAARRLADGAVKVGCSMNPYERMRQLSREHGALTWLGWWPTDDPNAGYDEEEALHRFFRGEGPQIKGRRDWYLPASEALLKWIEETLISPPDGFPVDYPVNDQKVGAR